MTTLVDWLNRAAGPMPATTEETGLRLLDRREQASWRSWPELVQSARSVAARLRRHGIEPGHRVALIYPTGWGFLDAFFGCILAGAVPTPLYPPVRLGRLDEYSARTAAMLRAANARLVLTDSRVLRVLGHALEEARPRLGASTLAGLNASASGKSAESFQPASSEALALIQFSSGTTVAPKPVALSHRAIVAQVETLSSFWPDHPDQVHSGVSWLPLYHDMGLIGGLLSALQRVATLTLIPPEVFVARPIVWLRAISTYRATISPAPNFAYALAADRIPDRDLAGLDLSSWMVALDGAESVAPSVLRRFCERFAAAGLDPAALTPVYGLSEASLAVTFSRLDEPFVSERFDRRLLAEQGRAQLHDDGLEIVSVGQALPGFEVEIRDLGSREVGSRALEESRVGAVWVRGPSLMTGYLDQPEATARVLRDGWLDTGDTGFLYRGDLYLTGRVKDLLIIRGRNHAPEEVEHAVGAVPGVRSGCVVARSEAVEGSEREQLFLFVERTRQRSSDAESDRVLEAACGHATLHAIGISADRVLLCAPGTLPRTSSGKLRRAETWRRFQSGSLAAAPTPGPLGLAGRILASEWRRLRIERDDSTEAESSPRDPGSTRDEPVDSGV